MDNSKKYSVIIRVRNEERWIGYAIQSIVDNIGEECEIIITTKKEKKVKLGKKIKIKKLKK